MGGGKWGGCKWGGCKWVGCEWGEANGGASGHQAKVKNPKTHAALEVN